MGSPEARRSGSERDRLSGIVGEAFDTNRRTPSVVRSREARSGPGPPKEMDMIKVKVGVAGSESSAIVWAPDSLEA